jgi:adenylosuccinate synthase
MTGKIEPIYEEAAGWEEDIGLARQFDDLPQNARDYIRRIEDITGVEPVIVSIGPDREETLLLKNPFAVEK